MVLEKQVRERLDRLLKICGLYSPSPEEPPVVLHQGRAEMSVRGSLVWGEHGRKPEGISLVASASFACSPTVTILEPRSSPGQFPWPLT